jgi:toxin FitB
MHDPSEEVVVRWMNSQPIHELWTTSVTVLEIQFGLEIMLAGRRRTALAERFERILKEIHHRVAVLDEEAARAAANLMASRQMRGKIGELRDTMIAGIVLAHQATFATRNVSHFSDISAKVVNPWVD